MPFVRTKSLIDSLTSSETQGQFVRAKRSKLGKKSEPRMFSRRAVRNPRNWDFPHHFQTALRVLAPVWTEKKSFVLFCPVGEQKLWYHFCVFLQGGCCIGHTFLVCSPKETFKLTSKSRKKIGWFLKKKKNMFCWVSKLLEIKPSRLLYLHIVGLQILWLRLIFDWLLRQ